MTEFVVRPRYSRRRNGRRGRRTFARHYYSSAILPLASVLIGHAPVLIHLTPVLIGPRTRFDCQSPVLIGHTPARSLDRAFDPLPLLLRSRDLVVNQGPKKAPASKKSAKREGLRPCLPQLLVPQLLVSFGGGGAATNHRRSHREKGRATIQTALRQQQTTITRTFTVCCTPAMNASRGSTSSSATALRHDDGGGQRHTWHEVGILLCTRQARS